MANPSPKTALLAGATGLIGSFLLPLLLRAPAYDRVIVVSRRAVDLEHPKLTQLLTPPEQIETALAAAQIRVDDAFCCLGTTIAKAGSQAAFRAVDHDLIVAFARAAKAAGAGRFLLVSAIGADAASAIFYSRVKGETERDVEAVGFSGLHIFRPSLLLGPRAERRPAETLGQIAAPLLNPLMIGALAPYRAIAADRVAHAMAAAAASDVTGKRIYTYEAIKRLAAPAN